jgi:nicotinate-nucleotide adenylyltransferase
MNIALFGTSADPPTRGHGQILDWLADHFDQVALWASDNPFKVHQASLEQRHAMLQVLREELGRDNLELYPQLSDRRSLVTVERAHRCWPEADLTLVIGADLVAQLPSWYQVQALLAQVQLLVIPRPGSPLDPAALAQLRDLGAALTIAAMEGLDVSSTAYRDASLDSRVVTPAVGEYIRQAGLYAWGPRSRLPQSYPAASPPRSDRLSPSSPGCMARLRPPHPPHRS